MNKDTLIKKLIVRFNIVVFVFLVFFVFEKVFNIKIDFNNYNLFPLFAAGFFVVMYWIGDFIISLIFCEWKDETKTVDSL